MNETSFHEPLLQLLETNQKKEYRRSLLFSFLTKFDDLELQFQASIFYVQVLLTNFFPLGT